MKQGINPSFKAVAPQAGKWSPKSSEGDDIWRVVDETCRNGHLQQQRQKDTRPVSPVWTPRSAQCSPVAARKQFRPVQFQSPQLERKFTRLSDNESGSQAPPWEQPGFDKLPPPVLPPHHHHHHQPMSDSKPVSSVRRLAQSFSAPRLNTLGGDDHSEPYSKHSRSYVCPPTRSLEGEQPRAQQWSEDKYATVPPNRDPVNVNRGSYDQVRDMANYSTREIPGVGPVTKEGMPISLRSEAKEHNQSDWYKQVYNTIHKPHGDDGFLTVRYKTRRGGATHKANGYMSEPEHGYESDYTYNSDAYSGITPQKPPGSYKMNPGRIEDYSPGQYQEPEKPRSTSTRPARTAAYTQGNLSRALKETGYESDNSFIVRKKGPLASAPSPEYQKQAYLHVQAGGEPPLQGFRKQLSAHPKDENAAEGTAAVPPPPPPVKAMKMHALDDVYNNKYDDDSSRQYVEGNVNIHYKSPIRQEFKGIIPEDELAEQQAEAMRAIYEQEKRRKQWQELEDLKNRRHTDNFTASQKSPISVHRFDDFVGVEGSAPKPKITTPLAKAKALYDFVGQSSRELTFSQGDIITIHRKVDANWYEGEHNAFCGLFPVDYVELISGAPAPMARAKPSEGLARAKYTFVAQSGIELSLNKGELVALTRQVDENWFEGRIANRKGIIPISYCEVITPIGKKVELPPSVVSTKREEIFIECAPERELKSSKTEILHVDTSSEPLMYRAVFKYVPQNPDELELFEGDTVLVLEKCDDGWFVGTSERTGCFGTFPGNYVQRI